MRSGPTSQRSRDSWQAPRVPAATANTVGPFLQASGGVLQMCRQKNILAGQTQYGRLSKSQPFISEFAYCVARQEYPNRMSDL